MSLAVGRMEANYSDNISDPYPSDSFQKGILGTKENDRIKKKKHMKENLVFMNMVYRRHLIRHDSKWFWIGI